MGWVVKSWNAEAVDRIVSDTARRELADGLAYLEELETFGVLTRRLVREKRAELRTATPEIEPAAPPPVPRITARRARASMRDSPLADLFRATA
ncbi:MAG: hypothetical protein ABI950_10090 [Solirubrobacteraceae bacterium]